MDGNDEREIGSHPQLHSLHLMVDQSRFMVKNNRFGVMLWIDSYTYKNDCTIYQRVMIWAGSKIIGDKNDIVNSGKDHNNTHSNIKN